MRPSEYHGKATEFVEGYFREHPKATVMDAARAANNADLPLSANVVAAIRRKVAGTPSGFNSPRLVVTPTPLPAPPAPVAPDEPAARDPRRIGMKEPEAVAARRAYVSELFEADPELTVRRAMELVTEKFGVGIGYEYTCETQRIARELRDAAQAPVEATPPVSLPAPPPEPPPPPPPVPVAPAPPPRRAAPDEDVVLVWLEPEEGSAELKRKLRVTRKSELPAEVMALLADGVASSDIRVFKEASMRVQFSVEVG